MRKNKLQLVIAVVMLAAAAVLLVVGLRYLGVLGAKEPQKVAPVAEETSAGRIVVANRTISRGQILSADALATIRIDGKVSANAFDRVEQVAGRIAVSDIHPHQIVVAEAVTAKGAGAGLAVLVPPGMRAVAIRVTDESAVANFLQPGDWADLHVILSDRVLGDNAGTEAHIMLQNVKVLTVGPAMSEAADKAERSEKRREARDITIAVTPDQANQVALMRSVASYSLSLRHPEDHGPVSDRTMRVTDLRGSDSASLPATAAAEIVPPAPPRRVDLLRGTERDSVILNLDETRL